MTLADPRQLAMFDLPPHPERPTEPAPVIVTPPALHVSAGRQLRALQRALPVVRDHDPDPPGLEGWRDYLGAERPRTDRHGQCSEVATRAIGGWACSLRCGWSLPIGPAPRRCPACVARLRPADDDPQSLALRAAGRPVLELGPCAWTACPHHLAVDVGETVQIGRYREAELVASTAGLPVEMGRRPSLASVPETQGEVDDFAAHVGDRLSDLPDTCELDVIHRYPDGAPVEVVAAALGVSEEVVRLCERAGEVAVAANVPREPGPPPSSRTPRTADPSPVPRAIVRVERDAPAPVELSADAIFTF